MALSANLYTRHRVGESLELKVKTNVHIYAGSLVMIDATGYAIPGADAAGGIFAGVALEEANNVGGASGAKTVRVARDGHHLFAATGMAITDMFAAAYIVDDETVGLAATTTNDVKCGEIVAVESATAVWVDISKTAAAAA